MPRQPTDQKLALRPIVRTGPINICIYCGAGISETKLTDEHVIPLSLGGTYILEKASCLRCAEATKNLEGYAGRHIFHDVRVEFGLPTRRPKQRPTHLPLRQGFAPSPEQAPIRLVPTKDYPGLLILVNHEPPGVLQGRHIDQGSRGQIFVRQITGRDRVEQLTAQGIDAKIYREFQPDLLMRLIAKIALGFSVGGYSLECFRPLPRLQQIILQRDVNPYHLAGGTTKEMDEFPEPQASLKLGQVPTVLHRMVGYMRVIQGVAYLAFQLQLFAYLDTPIYTVVVGELTAAGLKKFKPQ
jgi:hypothetical protein